MLKRYVRMVIKERLRVGIALSGGGARGAAHIGVLKILSKKLEITQLSGASAGAIIAAVFAAGKLRKMEKFLRKIKKNQVLNFFKPANSVDGVFDSKKIEEFMRIFVGNLRIEELNIPIYIAASDIKKGRIIYFKKGDVAKVVSASCAIPVIFTPVKINNMLLVDAGLLDNLPVKPIKKHSDITIGVDATSRYETLGRVTKTFMGSVRSLSSRVNLLKQRLAQNPRMRTLERTRLIKLILNKITQMRTTQDLQENYTTARIILKSLEYFDPTNNMGKPDFMIRPKVRINNMAFHNSRLAIKPGEEAAKKFLKKNKLIKNSKLL